MNIRHIVRRLLCLTAVGGALTAWPVQAQETPCQLHVNTFPAGAVVTCDGQQHGPAPVTLSTLTPGRHLVSASLANHHDVHRSLILQAGERAAIELELEPVKGLVLVRSTPSGCSVTVDGADRGRTPLLLGDLPLGNYRMRLEAEGHFPKEIELNITSRRPILQDIVLQSNSATLAITSTPAGASVLVNGVAKGKTPCQIAGIPSGRVDLQLSLAGHQPFTRAVVLNAGRTETLALTLTPIPATLRLVSIPEGARIYVANEQKGVAPVVLKNLQPGEYRVRAELPGFSPMFRTIKVERAGDTTEEFRLEQNSGTFQLTTQPAGVVMFIDGQNVGMTKSSKEETDAVSDPLTIERLPEGTHRVQLTRKRYYDEEFEIKITRKEAMTVHKSLRRRFIPDHEVKTRLGVFTGELVEIDATGGVKIETAVGVFKRIPAEDIITRGPLKDINAE